jgi:TfoX/Sxy family transcriptional regulator of competence genes
MVFDEGLAARIRDNLGDRPGIAEKRMFGGLAFLIDTKMFAAVSGDVLLVRVGAERYSEFLTHPDARPMDFTGRPMTGYLYISTEGIAEDADLAAWLERALEFTSTVEKAPANKPKKRKQTV